VLDIINEPTAAAIAFRVEGRVPRSQRRVEETRDDAWFMISAGATLRRVGVRIEPKPIPRHRNRTAIFNSAGSMGSKNRHPH